jgi:hypothetical protein
MLPLVTGAAPDGPAESRLPRAGFTHQSDGLAGTDIDGDTFERSEGVPADALGRIFDDQIVDDNEGFGHVGSLLRRHQGRVSA